MRQLPQLKNLLGRGQYLTESQRACGNATLTAVSPTNASLHQTRLSFEFFPPKTDEGDKNLLEKHIPELMKLRPDFCSVTYGAGGSTREKTIGIVDRIQREHGLTAMMHLTCVNSTQAQLREVIEDARAKGILIEHKSALHAIADQLMLREVLDAEQVKRLAHGLPIEDPAPAPVVASG